MTAIGRVILPIAAINMCTGIFTALLPQGNLARSGKRAMEIIALVYGVQLVFNLAGGYLQW